MQRKTEAAGAEADLERIVPELAASKLTHLGRSNLPKDAKMDLVLAWPGELQQQWIDVSIRSPHALHASKASIRAGAAATEGESEKASRYGTQVAPLVFETYGRLGFKSQQTLDLVVASARTFGRASTCTMRTWRLAMERQLVYSTADSYLRSLNQNFEWL